MEIGVWGDSITYGAGDGEALGWVGRFRKSLVENDDVSVYNFGVCGDTTEDLLKRFVIEAESIEARIVLFAIGINDSKYPVGKEESLVSLEKYKENMNELVDLAKKFTDKIYLIGPTKADEDVLRGSGSVFQNDIIKKYNDCVKDISETKGVVSIDVFDVLDIKTDLEDGLHPNSQGYDKMYRAIASEVSL